MELDDLKKHWEEVNKEPDLQQKLSTKMIDEMTRTKYNSSLRKILYPEIVGIIICIAAGVFIGFNFNKLDTPFFQATGVISILLLSTLSVISLKSLQQFNIGNVNKPYVEALKEFAIQKIRFHKFQKINITLSYLLLVTTIMLLPKIFGGKDIANGSYFGIAFALGFVFLLAYSKWVSKYYSNTLKKTEELLKELGS
jgi:Na+/glutamate symporter